MLGRHAQWTATRGVNASLGRKLRADGRMTSATTLAAAAMPAATRNASPIPGVHGEPQRIQTVVSEYENRHACLMSRVGQHARKTGANRTSAPSSAVRVPSIKYPSPVSEETD